MKFSIIKYVKLKEKEIEKNFKNYDILVEYF